MDVTVMGEKARALMDEYGLEDWSFRWSTAESEFGACWHGRKEIVMSRLLVAMNDEGACLDIAKHEIAHALVGPKAGHDWRWQEMAVRVGARPVRCYSRT